jgi:pyruvate carboxylase
MKAQKRLLITDTTMRDGHQSLLATRMRSLDMIKAAPAYARTCRAVLVECWGGATFDVAYALPAGMPVAAAARHARGAPNL